MFRPATFFLVLWSLFHISYAAYATHAVRKSRASKAVAAVVGVDGDIQFQLDNNDVALIESLAQDKYSAGEGSAVRFEDVVHTLLTKVSADNYTMSEIEKKALKIIKSYFVRLHKHSVSKTIEDKKEMENAKQAIADGCYNDTLPTINKAKSEFVNVSVNRGRHNECRTVEANAITVMKKTCQVYDEYRKSVTDIDCVPIRYVKDYIGSDDASKKRQWETCLEGSWPNLEKLQEHYEACKKKGGILNKGSSSAKNVTAPWKNEENVQILAILCKAAQTRFEEFVCEYAATLEDACTMQTSCRGREIKARDALHARIKISVAARKTDHEASERTLCMFAVLEADDILKPGKLEKCKATVVDTSAFDMQYPEIPAAKPCLRADPKPGDTAWLTHAYGSAPWYGKVDVGDNHVCP